MENQTRYLADLHCHTNRSDGSDTPQELIDHAAELHMEILAITDHDVRPPERIRLADGKEAELTEYGKLRGIQLLPGIEISCDTLVEDCHIICFGCDWKDPYFDELEQRVAASKIKSYRTLIRRLTEHGMPLTWEEVLDNNGSPIEEEHVQKKMIFELMARKGYAPDWGAAKLMVKNTPAYQISREKPDPIEVIAKIHNAGGIAIMAHPYLVNEPVRLPGNSKASRRKYIDLLIRAGLDGIEASYTYDKTSYGGTMTPEEIENAVRSEYSDRVSIISGGSDYHNDQKKGAKKIRHIGERGVSPEYVRSNSLLSGLLPSL
ncbi:MAG: PHP domain-containing protein [Bilifractor sp.]|jgi:predicted metal-dependent phosphoesterase TrpH